MSMLMWLTLPFYDFCGFRSVAVNSLFKFYPQILSTEDSFYIYERPVTEISVSLASVR